jgi:sugar phosphate isomerase/epimerase
MGDIKIGVSLFSFSYFYNMQLMDLEALLKKSHEMGYEGIEIVLAQMAPDYPDISDAWIDHFKELLKKYELQLVCWSAYIDMGIHSDRDLSTEEIYYTTCKDLFFAKKAGAPLVRTQHSITPTIFKKCRSLCKDLGVKLAIEMHAPHHPDIPVWKEYLEIMAEPESEGYLGVVPDFSIFQFNPHKQMVENYIAGGFNSSKLEDVIAKNLEKLSAEDIIARGSYTEYEKQSIHDITGHFQAPAKVKDLYRLIPYAPYIHGKFHYLDETGHNPVIPYEEIVPLIKELGYKGYIASEYEGWDKFAVVQLERYMMLMNRLLSNLK